MKNIKKILALVLAVMMIAALAVPAMAADKTDGDLKTDGIAGNEDGIWEAKDTPAIQTGKTAIIYKEITAFNPETCTVNAPTITYNYTIAAGAAGKNIFDDKDNHNPAANAHATTKAGVGAPVITGNVTGTDGESNANWKAGNLEFTPAVQFNASSTGEKNSYPIKIDFSGINFKTAGTGAGVYRYVITEMVNSQTTTDASNSQKNYAGIKDGDIAAVRYMDVYVDGNGDIYGFTCFENNNDIDASDTPAYDDEDKAAKTEGFVATTSGGADGATAETADQYYTFNFEVSKKVENDAYTKDTHHEFPFTIVLNNPNVNAQVLPIMTFSDDGSTFGTSASHVHQTALAAHAITDTWIPTIADSAVVKYVGIPCGTTVTITEKNDVVGVTYVSVSTNADVQAASKNIDTNAVSNEAKINCTAHLTAATENHTAAQGKQILFTNTLLTISPTGVAMRIAPYALILAMGTMLLLFSRKARKTED